MAYVMLYGVGWTQRWRIVDGSVDEVATDTDRVGHHETGRLPVVDPSTGEPTTLVVAWRHVAAAVVLGSDHADPANADSTGQYA
jgi:hypothetical protein